MSPTTGMVLSAFRAARMRRVRDDPWSDEYNTRFLK